MGKRSKNRKGDKRRDREVTSESSELDSSDQSDLGESDSDDSGLDNHNRRTQSLQSQSSHQGRRLPLDELILPIEKPQEDGSTDPNREASDPGGLNIASNEGHKRLVFDVTDEHSDTRIDLFLTLKIDGYSRVFLRRVVMDGHVLVDGRPVKPAFHVFPGQVVEVLDLPPPPTDGPIPEAIPIDILYEDEYLVAINKPAGMVVHPAKGHWSGTLTAALAHHFSQLSDAGGQTRPGIVHRLDRETSGVIVIAKTNEVHFKLCGQFEAREVQKTYLTIVSGILDRDRDRIVQPIGYHPYQREKIDRKSTRLNSSHSSVSRMPSSA